MRKKLLITLSAQEGERTHTHRVLHTTNAENIHFAAERYASKFWGEGTLEKGLNKGLWWFFGEMTVCVENVIELTDFEFDIISNVFSGMDKEYRMTEILKRF